MHKIWRISQTKKRMKKPFICLLCFVFVFIISFSVISPLQELFCLEDGFLADYQDVQIINKTNRFGALVHSSMEEKENTVDGQKQKKNEIVFKLFGFIPIKKVAVQLATDEDFYVGGVPIGLSICTDGAIVVSDEAETCLKEGDIISKINGQHFFSLEEAQEILQSCKDEAEIEYLRKNKTYKTLIKTSKDETGALKLGLWVKDDVSGVGTLTFVNKKTGDFGALGHPIVDANSGNVVPVTSGKIYPCSVIGIDKGKRNDPGELKCVFFAGQKSKGDIDDNSKFGISGTLNDVSGLVDENVTAKLGGRLGVKIGDAKIMSSISGLREEYDIEIIKASYQKTADDKSIVFRVKDPRLLKLTGGIVQGMSGSPIMQDGKIIGAVTHVFLNDPTKGYGVYVDWMI